MGITAGDLPKAGWTAELLDSILWRLNQFHGRDPFKVQTFFDWAAEWWEIKIADPRDRLKYVMLKVPAEYETTQPTLRFDDIVTAVKDGLEADILSSPSEVDIRQYVATRNVLGRMGSSFSDAAAAMQQLGQTMTTAQIKVGEIVKYDGRSYRVLSVSPDGLDIQLAPVENTVDPEVVSREREVLEAQEAEALEIMREALRRSAS